ncbi:hypothetical protein [Hydrogenophaga sp.]|uniref:hypothetical protein n=1 Tax=Hydrogenophaga sp. TaxID=1904254 RepID=UPI0027207608|nr:hypothetical protein [Hydrogenophaga sp.]MDO9436984.1 hypothetical protein [Hydrogenophaga sp.]
MDSTNSSSRSGVAGTKRAAPDTDFTAPEAQQFKATSTPDAIFERWQEALNDTGILANPRVAESLSQVACGKDWRRCGEPFDLLDSLIACGAFKVFAEVFVADTEIQRTEWQRDWPSAPFKSGAHLRVPVENQPDYAALALAFDGIQVDAVRVTQQRNSSHNLSLEALAMPTSVSHCIASLLKAGANELHLYGTLSAPEVVAEAMVASLLEVVVFEPIENNERNLCEQDFVSYRALAGGLSQCKKLRHLKVQNGRLLDPRVQLYKALETLAQHADHPLESIRFNGRVQTEVFDEEENRTSIDPVLSRSWREDESEQCALIAGLVPRFPNLSVFDAHVCIASAHSLYEKILLPMTGHPALRALKILSVDHFAVSGDNMKMIPKLFTFALSCPNLTDLDCEGAIDRDDDNVDLRLRNLQAYVDKGGDIDQTDEIETLVRQVKSRNLALRHFRLYGTTVPARLLEALFGAMADNTSLEDVDLRGNLLALLSVAALFEEWRRVMMGVPSSGEPTAGTSLTLDSLGLPSEFNAYYLMCHGRVHGFREGEAGVDSDDEVREYRFALDFRRDDDEAVRERVSQAFEPLRFFADSFLREFQKQLTANHRKRQLLVAAPELRQNLKGFLYALTKVDPVLNPGMFDGVSEGMLRQLDGAGELDTVARLPLVSKFADLRGQHKVENPPYEPTMELRRLALEDLAFAHEQKRLARLGDEMAITAAIFESDADADLDGYRPNTPSSPSSPNTPDDASGLLAGDLPADLGDVDPENWF